MNALDATVTKVLDKPYFQYDVWWVPVEYNSWGRLANMNIMCLDLWEVAKVKVGYKFLC